MALTLLSASHCHLCDTALSLVQRACPNADIAIVDIGEDDTLIERYGTRIPVLREGQRELAWPFSLLDVRAFMDVDAEDQD